MSQLAIRVPGAQGLVVALYQALFGKAPSYATLQTLTARASTDPAAFAQAFAGAFSYLSDAELANLVLANLNVTATTVGQGNLVNLQAVLPQLFATFGVPSRGAIIVNLANILADLQADPVYGTAATGFNNQLLANQVYANNAASTADSVVVPPVFTVTLTFDAQSAALARTVGTAVAFTAHANGAQRYQWFRSGVAIAGATTDTLKIGAVAFGDDGVSYAVTAQGSNGSSLTSQAMVLSVTPATAPTVITGCMAITVPGSYVLKGDIGPSSNGTECIAIHDISSVQLDCAGHAIAMNPSTYATPTTLTNVRDFSIKNCRMTSQFLTFTNITNGVISKNSFTPPDPKQGLIFWAYHPTQIVYDGNTLVGTLQQNYPDSTSITNNTLGGTTQVLPAVIVSNYGRHNRIIGNTLDGGWDGQQSTGAYGGRSVGTQDGITVTDESDLVVANNVIKNVWFCGLQSQGLFSAPVVRDNHIISANVCGIGGWLWNSVVGGTFARNTIEQSGAAFNFYRAYGLRPAKTDSEGKLPADTAVYFKDNVFEANTIVNPMFLNGAPIQAADLFVYDLMMFSGVVRPGETLPTAGDFKISNNVLKNNNFGKLSYAPRFGISADATPGYITDGGGNQCQAPFAYQAAQYPIACN